MYKLLLLVAAAGLAGCAAQPRVLPGDSYLIDTKLGLMCRVHECYYLSLINASYKELDVAKPLGLPLKAYSWSTEEFVNLMVQPPGQLYAVTQLSETEFKLPMHPATNAAFNLLFEEDLQIYKIGGEGKSF